MATMPPIEATRGILFGQAELDLESTSAPRLMQRDAAVFLAASAYERSVHKSRTATVVAFLVAAAFATLAEGSLFLPMAVMLVLAIASAATTDVLARQEFVKIVRAYAQRQGLSDSDSQGVSSTLFAEWSTQSTFAQTK